MIERLIEMTNVSYKTEIKEKMSPGGYNAAFGILSALAIIMVVAGHLGYNILTVGDLFPYYSFHVPLFMFISGYFYREEEQERPFSYIKRKARRLLLPYFIWNLIYGLVAWGFRSFGDFTFGEPVTLKTVFLDPFLHGYQYLYNFAAWFVPVLFLIEVMNLFMRMILKALHLNHEWLILAVTLAVGMAVIWLAITGHVWGLYKMPGRILFLFPCFQMGQFYRQKLERHDRLGNLPYFAIVIGIQVLLNVCCNGLAYSCVWCTGFANGPVIPYVTVVSGIAFWLRVSKILAPVFGQGSAVARLGQNTYPVMMHHIMVFMLIKMILAGIAAGTGFLSDFDFARFYTDIDYCYLIKGSETFKMVYLAAGIVLPFMLQRGMRAVLPAVGRLAWRPERDEEMSGS